MLLARITLAALLVAIAIAQSNEYNFVVQCPEGCRDIDKQISCGDVHNAKTCVMEVNGDVTLTCTNGDAYSLGVHGCQTTLALPYLWRQCEAAGSKLHQWWIVYFAPYSGFVAIAEAAAGIVLILGPLIPRVALYITAVPIGALLGFGFTFLCNIQQQDWVLYGIMCVGAIAMIFCAFLGLRASVPVHGFMTALFIEGVVIGIVILLRSSTLANVWWGTGVLMICVAATWGFSARWNPWWYFGMMLGTFAGILCSTAATQWKDSRTFVGALEAQDFLVVGAVFAGSLLLTFATNVIARRQRVAVAEPVYMAFSVDRTVHAIPVAYDDNVRRQSSQTQSMDETTQLVRRK